MAKSPSILAALVGAGIIPTSSGGAVTPLAISGTPGAAQVGTAYSFTPTVSGGSGTKSYSLSGSLPAGLSFSSSTGAISGTPTTAGTTSGIGITVTDSSGSATLSGRSIVVSASSAIEVNMPATVASVLGFGDSITLGQNATTAANQWVNRLQVGLGAGTLRNKGIAGTVLQNSPDAGGSARANNGRDRYVADTLGANLSEFYACQYGYNDARYVGAPTTFNVTQFENDLREVLDGWLGAGVYRDRIGLGIPWPSDVTFTQGSAGFTGQTRAGFEAYVDAIKRVAADYEVYYAPVYETMRDNGGASLLDTDAVHPTDTGHQVIYNAWMAAKRTVKTPAAITSASSVSIAENSVLNHTLTADEKDVTWAIAGGADAALFSIAGNVLTLTARDYEAPTDADSDNVYVVTVRCTNAGGFVSVQTISVTVTDALDGNFVYDTFTDADGTAITSHTGEIGATWTRQAGFTFTDDATIDGNRVHANAAAVAYQASGSPPGADYEVEAVIDFVTTVASDAVGVAARMQAGANTFYFAHFRVGTGLQLFRVVNGVNTQIGANVAVTWTSGQTKTLKLQAQGTTLKVFLDGTEYISQTDGNIAGAGKAGFRIGNNQAANVRLQMTQFTARTIT